MLLKNGIDVLHDGLFAEIQRYYFHSVQASGFNIFAGILPS
jgi:hypothetical protein